MFIEEVSIDGFKSYARATIVPNFDPKFNAITGLNGSGKSNILDSICFVLGITKLDQVRANSLQELVYKQGQAGVTKASVSIVFNNSDRASSPVGYEDSPQLTVTRQIVIGGRNKYLINGHLAQPNRVQNLFHSVQLNVNNPHFLIMQGRITKVLNMKPAEILSMLEEAAGTRMYEMKKETAIKTLDKKHLKMEEIDRVLGEEILPALENLRRERAQYQQWTQGNADLVKLKNFVIAATFVQAERAKNSAQGEMDEVLRKIEELRTGISQLDQEIVQKQKQATDLLASKDKEMGPVVVELAERVDQLSKDLVKETSKLTSKRDTLKAEMKANEKLLSSLKELEASIAEKSGADSKALEEVETAEKVSNTAAKQLSDAELEFQGVQAGKSGAPGEDKSLQERLSEAKAEAVDSATEAKQAKIKIQHLQKELGEKNKVLKSKQKEAAGLQKEVDNRQQEVSSCQQGLETLGFHPERMEELEQTKKVKSELVRELRTKVGELESNLNVGFQYKDPVKDFDRSSVKGMVAKLFSVADISNATALEVVAGGKMYNVVVDTEQTGKVLLAKGQMKRRVTLIPLNKIEGRSISQQKVARAVQLVGAENVTTALSLVKFDKNVSAAMAYVFGNHFVCKDSETARKVAFHPDIMTPCVTLEGDVFSPSGLLTGGSRRVGPSLLTQLHHLADLESQLRREEKILEEITKELAALAGPSKQHRQLSGELELKKHELGLLQGRLEQSEYHQLAQEVASIQSQVAGATAITDAAKGRQRECAQKVGGLEREINDFGRERERRMKELEKRIKGAKVEAAAAMKELKSKQHARERMQMDREASVKERDQVQEQMSAAQTVIIQLKEEVAAKQEVAGVLEERYRAAESELKEKRKAVVECDREVARMKKEEERMQKEVGKNEIEVKKLEHQAEQMRGDQKRGGQVAAELLKKHEWIHTERALFGQAGGDYDFGARNFREAEEELKAKQTEQHGLEKRVNKKVMNMFESAEKEYTALLTKKSIVQTDKQKIKQVIEELDEKKQEALRVTWEKVTKDFGSIFSTLLPGTMAKLEPSEGADFMAGLEVKVAFGSVWKLSLSELSGGQRSLLALSLILALLLFKPAPLYILDEVDAALDLSHTQNIGRMIKEHFPQSQFIVVSLKEGMFNNANVVYRTKFVEGVSTVTRTVPPGAAQANRERAARGKAPHSTPSRWNMEAENIDPNPRGSLVYGRRS